MSTLETGETLKGQARHHRKCKYEVLYTTFNCFIEDLLYSFGLLSMAIRLII